MEPTTGCLERTPSRVKCCTEAQKHMKDTRSHTLAHVLSHVPLSERDSVMIAAPGIRSIQESADCVSCTPILIRVRAWQCPRLLGNGRGQEILQGPISSATRLASPFPSLCAFGLDPEVRRQWLRWLRRRRAQDPGARPSSKSCTLSNTDRARTGFGTLGLLSALQGATPRLA